MKLTKKITELFSKLLSHKIIKWGLIPALLVILWISLSLTYSSYRSFTVLQYPHNLDEINKFQEKKLLKDQKMYGIFRAKEDSLGIISVIFGHVPKLDFDKEDMILFRIKEKGQLKWLYENKYRSGGIPSNKYFPFGFEAIKNSKGKIYEFEIISLRGNKYNSIETKQIDPIYLSKYKFSKAEIFKDPYSIIEFMSKKISTFFNDHDALFSSFAFLLPLFFYMFWIIFHFGKWVRRVDGKKLFAILISILIFADVILYEISIAGFTLGLLILWIFSIYINRLKSNITFFFALTLLVLSVLVIYFNLGISMDKMSAFAYLLIIVGFLQSLVENKRNFIKK